MARTRSHNSNYATANLGFEAKLLLVHVVLGPSEERDFDRVEGLRSCRPEPTSRESGL
jgi:hypothetical protein